MGVVHASRNDTGQVYVRTMHDGRNDRMKWIPRICHLVAYCLNEIGVGCRHGRRDCPSRFVDPYHPFDKYVVHWPLVWHEV